MKNSTASKTMALNVLLDDYGMLLVLFVLGLLFSVLTFKEQHPTGADAGRQVAGRVAAAGARTRGVLIVARDTREDREFSHAAADLLRDAGIPDLAVVNGSPRELRMVLEQRLSAGRPVDVVIANDVTAAWTVYDRFPEVGREKVVTPAPYRWPDFLKPSNLLGVASQTAIYAIIAIGMTMVIVSGGIDLSVGSLVALAAVSSAWWIREFGGGPSAAWPHVLSGMAAGILISAGSGAAVGAVVAGWGIPSFIVTLSVMMMASGLAFRLSDGQSISQLPDSFLWLGGGRSLGLPNPVLLMGVLYLVAHFVMSRTVFGRYVYAIGGNAEAARLSGVPVRRMLWAVYTLCGALAGLGGVVLASQLAAGDPKFGQMYELEVIAAVVVGGTSLMGGQGKIFGTLIGAFIIAVIRNGMNLTNVDPFNQKIVLGGVLLAAVMLDTLKRGRR